MIYELEESGLSVSSQIILPVFLKDIALGLGFKIDLLVEETVIVEIKSVREL
jgi:GxxExxY protein